MQRFAYPAIIVGQLPLTKTNNNCHEYIMVRYVTCPATLLKLMLLCVQAGRPKSINKGGKKKQLSDYKSVTHTKMKA